MVVIVKRCSSPTAWRLFLEPVDAGRAGYPWTPGTPWKPRRSRSLPAPSPRRPARRGRRRRPAPPTPRPSVSSTPEPIETGSSCGPIARRRRRAPPGRPARAATEPVEHDQGDDLLDLRPVRRSPWDGHQQVQLDLGRLVREHQRPSGGGPRHPWPCWPRRSRYLVVLRRRGGAISSPTRSSTARRRRRGGMPVRKHGRGPAASCRRIRTRSRLPGQAPEAQQHERLLRRAPPAHRGAAVHPSSATSA